MPADKRATIIYTAEDQTKAAAESVKRNLRSVGDEAKRFSELNRDAGRTLQTAFAFIGGTALLKDILSRTIESERALNQLSNTLKVTGFAAGQTAGDIRELVEELSDKSAFDDDDIQKAANALLRFRDIQGETFREALRLVPDVATALDTDLVSAAQALGKGLEDPAQGLRSLRAAGVALTQTQKDLIEQLELTGDKAGAAKVFLDAVAKSTGGAAAGENVGLYGSLKGTEKAWDNLLKTIGKSRAIQGLAQDSLGGASALIRDLSNESGRGAENLKGFFAELGKMAAFAKLGPIAMLGGELFDTLSKTNRSRPVEGKVRGFEDPEAQKARIGALQSQIDQANEAAVARQKQRDKDQQTLQKVRLDATLEAERRLASQREEILDRYYDRGLVSTRDYYAARQAISEASLQADVKAINAAIALQQGLLKRAKPEERAGHQAEIERLQSQRAKVESQTGFEALKNSQAEQDAERRLADAIGEVNAKLLEQQGLRSQAASIRFEQENEQLRNQIRSNFGPDSGAEKRLDELKRLQVASAQLAEQDERAGRLRSRLSIEEERIQNSRRVGAISELEALRQTDEARKNALTGLRETARQMEIIANATKDPKQLQAVEQFKVDIESLAASADLVGDKFRTLFQDNLSQPLADFALGVRSAGDAVEDFVKGVERSLINMASQNFAEQIFGKGGAASGIPNFFAGLFNSSGGASSGGGFAAFLAGLFGSGGGGSAAAASSIPIGLAGGGVVYRGRLLDLPRYYAGGVSRRPAIFGEGRMAEAAVPLPDGRRIPVDLRGGQQQRGPVQINMPITVVAQDVQSFRASEGQVGTSVARGLRRYLARS